MTFFGKKRWAKGPDGEEPHPHESPAVMTWPLIVLAALSLVGGAGLLYVGGGIVGFLEPVVGEEHPHLPAGLSVPVLTALTLLVVLAGVGVAWLVFGRRDIPETAPQRVSPVTYAARKDLFGDAFNEVVLMRPGQETTKALVAFDDKGIDGVVNGVAAFTAGLSDRLRRLQTGFVRSYALAILGGAAFVVVGMLVVRLG